ncbi:MAG: adenine-specific DNA-methyltransferase, partial [Pseudomonadota bacterium]|nr:adenine-specific DNA-methyltransferase [Pseudomonadota bacterium]
MNKHEQKFYTALSDLFVGAEVDGVGGFIKLMKFKRQYYQSIEKLLKLDIYEALKKQPSFREDLFDKLYQFFSLYFTQNGCIYFNHTPFHNQIYDKVYNGKDVALFWKTNMLYYVKSDKLWRSLPIKFAGYDFYFDATELEQKANNTKNGLVYTFKDVTKTPEDKPQINFVAKLSSNGNKTKIDEIRNALTKQSINLSEEEITKLFAIFEKQNEVDFFINKDAKAFLTEQFKLWIYQYFWNGSDDWSVARVEQLTILKNIANKVINFIGQFEDELVKIWNKPKFVRNSNYVVTLDKLIAKGLDIALLTNHAGMQAQIQEWQDLGIV